MIRSPVVRRALVASGVLVLLALAWGTISGAIAQLPRAKTLGQQAETAVQLASGALDLLVIVTCFRWRRWEFPIRAAWAGSLALAGDLSALVWGPALPAVGLVFAAVALLLALLVIWMLNAGLAA